MSNDIAECVRRVLEDYLRDLDGQASHAIYGMVMDCAERSMLEVIMKHTHGNQTAAADMLGISRNMLRRKLTRMVTKPTPPLD
ncbi:MAG: helix-turn-helix domain-containing protein [Rhodocyclaceae bacterium]|nr:helix-turn-helix domain-containing protein [Rhodocyclaceae bacterium]